MSFPIEQFTRNSNSYSRFGTEDILMLTRSLPAKHFILYFDCRRQFC